jgi:hypothetical protein
MWFDREDLSKEIGYTIESFFLTNRLFICKSNLDEFNTELLKDLNLFIEVNESRLYIETLYKKEDVSIAFITKYSNNLIMNVCTDLSLEEFNNLINKLKAYADRYIYKETTKNLNKFEEDNNFRKEAVNFIKKKLGL